MKTIIVAYDKKFGIGFDNDLLWKRDLPADLLHFRDLTVNSTIIMGRKTFESIGRPLPRRRNIVVTSQKNDIAGCEIADSIEKTYEIAGSDNIFVIGGGQIYNQSIESVDRIIATEVDYVFDDATVFFPLINNDSWYEVSRDHHLADDKNKYNFDFVIYDRIK